MQLLLKVHEAKTNCNKAAINKPYMLWLGSNKNANATTKLNKLNNYLFNYSTITDALVLNGK